MTLILEHVSRTVEGQTWIDDACLNFEPGSFNVLLGRTLSGKTSLMRLMAGLDKPDSVRPSKTLNDPGSKLRHASSIQV